MKIVVLERNNEIAHYRTGTLVCLRDGVPHREDGPAVFHPDGGVEWWQFGRRHRADGPAVITDYGRLEWWVNGQRHRDGGPAIVHPHGQQLPPDWVSEWWYFEDRLHRDDGGPAVIEWYPYAGPAYTVPHREWWHHGHRHRINGPAVITPDGHQEWWCRGQRHRAIGPAVIRADGTVEFWRDGKRQPEGDNV